MKVLIVESDSNLRRLWAGHLRRRGCDVYEADGQSEAIACIQSHKLEVIVMSLVLANGSGLAVADYASYRQPETKVIFVNRSNFFSDGSIFEHMANVCTMMPAQTAPEDLSAVVEHYLVH